MKVLVQGNAKCAKLLAHLAVTVFEIHACVDLDVYGKIIEGVLIHHVTSLHSKIHSPPYCCSAVLLDPRLPVTT